MWSLSQQLNTVSVAGKATTGNASMSGWGCAPNKAVLTETGSGLGLTLGHGLQAPHLGCAWQQC